MTDAVGISILAGLQVFSDAKGISMVAPDQCRAARILLGWSANELAAAAKIGIATVKRFESGQPVQAATVDAIEKELVDAGVILIADGQRSPIGGPGVRLAAAC